jgi:hypothetical protein
MATWLDAITNPLEAATKALQELMEVRDLVKFGDTFRKMHSEILAAQQSALGGYKRELALLDEINALKARVANFETWDTQKQRYELKSLGSGGYAYMLKPDARGAETPHWVCANCFSSGRVSVIQYGRPQTRRDGRRDYFCPSCNNEVAMSGDAFTPGTQDPRWLD